MPRKWPVQLVSWNYKTRCHRACSLSQCGRAGSCSVCKSQYPFRGAMSRPCLVPCLPAGSICRGPQREVRGSWTWTWTHHMVQRRQQPAYVFFAETCRGARQMTAAAGRRGASRGRRPISTRGELSSPSPPSCSAEYLCLGNMQLKVPSPTQTLAATSLPAWYFPPMSRGISRRQNGTAATDLD